MPYSIDITSMSGGASPVSYFICDQNGNNCTLLGSAVGVYVLPIFYQSATILMVQAIDANGCNIFEFVDCTITPSFITTEDDFVLTTESGESLLY